jgi:uncharacterized membrane protein
MTPPERAKDAGLALFLLCWIGALTLEAAWLELAGIATLVVVMTAPRVFAPFARVWFGFSNVLGSVMSSVLFAVLFFAVVVPVAVVRRWAGHDAMKLREWKRSRTTVFTARDHVYLAEDLERPY